MRPKAARQEGDTRQPGANCPLLPLPLACLSAKGDEFKDFEDRLPCLQFALNRHQLSPQTALPRDFQESAMAAETSFQFQCPSCSAVLQATLQKELTSVQCGECYDVFDVQPPGTCAPPPRARAFA